MAHDRPPNRLPALATVLGGLTLIVAGLGMAGLLPGEHLVPYLNRLADLVWVMARAAEQAEARSSTPARTAPGAVRNDQ